MLVLTRRTGESIHIYPSDKIRPDMTVAELFRDGPFEIHIRKINPGQVRISIKAPHELTILRNELERNPASEQDEKVEEDSRASATP